MRHTTPDTHSPRSPLRRAGRAVAGAAVVVGLGVLAPAAALAQVGGPVGPTSTTTTTEADEPTSTTTEADEPASTTTTVGGGAGQADPDETPADADADADGDEAAAADDGDDGDDGGTSIVALGAVGLVAFLIGLAVAGLPLLAALSKRKAAAAGPGPVPPAAPTPPPAVAPAPGASGGPAIGPPPARDTDHVRAQRVALVEAVIALRDKLPSEALATEAAEALASAGITEVRPEGQPFDPAQHRAVHQVATDDPARHGTIASVERPGYTDGTSVIRQPEVVVAVHGSPS